jgi:DNA-binding transcriptional LysR family regulator
MEFRQLEHLLAAAQHGGLRAAAETAAISQRVVSLNANDSDRPPL